MDARNKEFYDESQFDLFSDQVLTHINDAYRFCLVVTGDEKASFQTLREVCEKIKKDSTLLHINQDGRLFVIKLCWESINSKTFKDYSLSLAKEYSLEELSVHERATVATSDFLDLSFSESCELLGWEHDQYIKSLASARNKVIAEK